MQVSIMPYGIRTGIADPSRSRLRRGLAVIAATVVAPRMGRAAARRPGPPGWVAPMLHTRVEVAGNLTNVSYVI
jgi:hypothetical protein